MWYISLCDSFWIILFCGPVWIISLSNSVWIIVLCDSMCCCFGPWQSSSNYLEVWAPTRELSLALHLSGPWGAIWAESCWLPLAALPRGKSCPELLVSSGRNPIHSQYIAHLLFTPPVWLGDFTVWPAERVQYCCSSRSNLPQKACYRELGKCRQGEMRF